VDRKINAAAFKARCLALIDEVAETGQSLTVTKRGKAKVQIVAVREKPKTLFGALKGSFEIVGDIVGPTITDVEDRLDRQARLINGQFDDPLARYAHRTLAGGGLTKAGKKRATRVRRGPGGK
jgi:antitoxin (DNA-binding transcriptional repressor) of toxin-antitoxin stability system